VAQNITVDLQDDLDGGPADETVRFGVDSAEYEIDLSKKNAAAFRRKLAPFIDHARKAGRGQRRRAGRAASAAATSGRGLKTRTLRSAPVGASPPASLRSTKPPPKDADAAPASLARTILALTASQRRARPGRHAAMCAAERPDLHVMHVIFRVISDSLDGLCRS
jgi:Lsr2